MQSQCCTSMKWMDWMEITLVFTKNIWIDEFALRCHLTVERSENDITLRNYGIEIWRWEMPSHCISHNSHIEMSMGKLFDSEFLKAEWKQSYVVHANLNLFAFWCHYWRLSQQALLPTDLQFPSLLVPYDLSECELDISWYKRLYFKVALVSFISNDRTIARSSVWTELKSFKGSTSLSLYR